ncbi:MAG: class I SAM-dependent methyltransferase [Thermodesulfobacteriota bacterium]|nr:class I SAM-dependent methyltransferase [Thermodesulfobacteriota bacterium]
MSGLHHYPSSDPDALLKELGIDVSARILDAGSGGSPFKYADVIVDRDFSPGNRHRDGIDGLRHKTGHACVQADIQSLPFKDNAFDFVVCMHVLEHVACPDRACEELMRVARAGYIETPRKWTEFYAGHPAHIWLVDTFSDKIVFEPADFDDFPFINFALPPLWESEKLQHRLFSDFPGIPNVQLAWKSRFACEVKSELPERLLEKEYLAERHYCFARNLLLWMGDFSNGAFHAQTAAGMVPDCDRYLRLSRFYKGLTCDFKTLFFSGLSWKMTVAALVCRILQSVSIRCLRFYRTILRRAGYG